MTRARSCGEFDIRNQYCREFPDANVKSGTALETRHFRCLSVLTFVDEAAATGIRMSEPGEKVLPNAYRNLPMTVV